MKNIFRGNSETGRRLVFGSLIILICLASSVTSYTSDRNNIAATAPDTVVDLIEASTTDAQSCLYGGVEIGASGVKAIAIRVLETDEGYSATEIFSPRTANTNIMEDVARSNKMRADRIDETAKMVSTFCDQMLALGVPSDQLYVVGSSGLRGENLRDLSQKVKEKTNRDMTFLTVDDEVAYAISGTVPKYTRVYVGKGKRRRVRRFDNRGRSIFIDVGSGNTKGGYQERISPAGPPEYRFVSFGVPFGTKTLADKVGKVMPGDLNNFEFGTATRSLYRETFGEPLRLALDAKPGLVNRPRIYLTGGIVWALATLIHPDDRRAYVPLTPADIERFYDDAVQNPNKLYNPDLSRLDSQTREKAESDINAIQSTFSTKQLIAGAQILKSLSNDLMIAQNRREMRFVRSGYIAWILRYVNLKSTDAETTSCQ